MQDILKWQEPISADLRQFLESQRQMSPANHWHRDAIARLEPFTTGGKLLRGSLVCFAYEAFGGADPEAARRTAAAIELFHSALLIHDDIMDRDALRRGSPSVHRQYQELAASGDAEHFGESMAICVGDAAIFLAFERLGGIDVPLENRQRLHALNSGILATVCAGQMLDIDIGQTGKRGDSVKKRDIMTVMEQKTGLYSVALPLAAGAILASETDATIRQLTQLGTSIGTIFQIRDDELGIFGDSSKTGKPVGSDIKEGKKTLLYYYVMRHCAIPERKRLRAIFGNQAVTEDEVSHVQRIMKESGISSLIQRDIDKLSEQASGLIDRLPVKRTDKATLHALLEFCALRNA